jgi:hypothetical protein
VTRNGVEIFSHGVRGGVNPGISYSLYYEGVDAAIEAGATLEEVRKWVDGEYDTRFMALIIAWNRTRKVISNHTEDAVATAMKRRGK